MCSHHVDDYAPLKTTFRNTCTSRNYTIATRRCSTEWLCDILVNLTPLIYTATVGQACLEFGHMFKRPRGMYFSADDVGQMNAMVQNWPMKDVAWLW